MVGSAMVVFECYRPVAVMDFNLYKYCKLLYFIYSVIGIQ
jgi:hypothetical protein